MEKEGRGGEGLYSRGGTEMEVSGIKKPSVLSSFQSSKNKCSKSSANLSICRYAAIFPDSKNFLLLSRELD